MGLRPRNDAKIELDPIDIGWDHFTANNIRYRDTDLTVMWDDPGGERHYGDAVPAGLLRLPRRRARVHGRRARQGRLRPGHRRGRAPRTA